MKAASPDRSSAGPILLNEAALEHVLDVFLPEDPSAAAAARARTNDADPADVLFDSETQEAEEDGLVIRAVPESPRLWRTYAPPTRAERVVEAALKTNRPARTPRRVPSWVLAAAVAIGFAIGAIAIP